MKGLATATDVVAACWGGEWGCSGVGAVVEDGSESVFNQQ